MLRVRACSGPGLNLAVSAQRCKDYALFDFADGQYRPSPPAQPTLRLAEGSGIFAGRYEATYGPTPGGIWWDGLHAITFHDLTDPSRPRVAFEGVVEFFEGDNRFPLIYGH